MRFLIAMAFVCFLAAAGCERPAALASTAVPEFGDTIASGELVSGTLWRKPVQSPGETGSNSGTSPEPGSRVRVYSEFILVTDKNGVTQLSPHGWYTDLCFKADAR